MPIPIRPAVASVPPYKPGKPAPVGPDGSSFKLSSNENPYPPLPGVIEAAQHAVQRMNRYPDMANAELTAALAAKHGVGDDEIALSTGSVAVLYNLLQTVITDGDEVLYAWRSFEAYPIAVQLTGARSVPVPLGPGATHDLEAMLAAITPASKVILVCTPNNPTGPIVPHDQLADFIDQVRDDIMIIIDEAYLEFATAPDRARFDDLRRPNVVTMRTFSKAYGLAGFRVGYCIADPAIAGAVRAAATPFGVSAPAQAAALASLAADADLLARVEELIKERTAVVTGLRDLGLAIPDSESNFVWIPAGERTAAWAAEFEAAGLAVRPFTDEPDAGIRITVGEPEANKLVLQVAGTLKP
ncbi:putative phenylalanine aminotransferase [Microlunatus endophyticus]|uniref:Histidinol-phosphate aminotransferase n=1 Tax=Microlunatus endophyticus TaxID=1716077 RepID=A0A917S5Q2_9ACTN|nr:histidinol-phosphate transaminase [Microlunatus endophyticus]GGL58999.1 putative phenylalanine aminotransferase [Microlunatus endophyticus]